MVVRPAKQYHTTRETVKWSDEHLVIVGIQIIDLLQDGSNAQFDLVRGEEWGSDLQIDFESTRGGPIAYNVIVTVLLKPTRAQQVAQVVETV